MTLVYIIYKLRFRMLYKRVKKNLDFYNTNLFFPQGRLHFKHHIFWLHCQTQLDYMGAREIRIDYIFKWMLTANKIIVTCKSNHILLIFLIKERKNK